MGSNKDSGSGKPGRDGGSGGMVDVHGDDFNDSVSVTVGQYGASEVNAYKGGILKPKSDPSRDCISLSCTEICMGDAVA